ncbi:MAG: hypothetical protein NUK62_04455 [Tenericutes bacterium]|nr:hypothetical protein [Mycoplasmatota bacterium]
MKLLITIVGRHVSEKVSKITGGGVIDYQATVPGVGTATSEIMEYLSLGDPERDVIFSLVDDGDVEQVFQHLILELDFLKLGMGVAFTVALDGISEAAYKSLYQEMVGDQNGKK